MGLENFDKENAIKILLLTIITVATTFSAVQTYQLKSIILNGGEVSAPSRDSGSSRDKVKKPSEYKFGVDYNKAVKAKKPMIVLFYADWCGYCIRFMPIYEKLYKAHKNQFNFVKVNVEDDKYRDVVEKYEIAGFPTVFMVNTQDDTHQQLMNQDFGDMKKLNSILDDFYKDNK